MRRAFYRLVLVLLTIVFVGAPARALALERAKPSEFASPVEISNLTFHEFCGPWSMGAGYEEGNQSQKIAASTYALLFDDCALNTAEELTYKEKLFLTQAEDIAERVLHSEESLKTSVAELKSLVTETKSLKSVIESLGSESKPLHVVGGSGGGASVESGEIVEWLKLIFYALIVFGSLLLLVTIASFVVGVVRK